MRKLLSGLLVLVMLVALLPVTALAAQEVGLVEADAVLENGTVVLTLTAAEETTSGRLTVEYDNALLTYAGLKEAGTVTSEDAGEHAVTFAYATSSQNALKAGSVLATLEFTVKTDVPATWLTVTVEDDGVGIPDIEKAMEPMYTTKPQLDRSGMGFSFMEAFMDELHVVSGQGRGTSVRMRKKIGSDRAESGKACDGSCNRTD